METPDFCIWFIGPISLPIELNRYEWKRSPSDRCHLSLWVLTLPIELNRYEWKLEQALYTGNFPNSPY